MKEALDRDAILAFMDAALAEAKKALEEDEVPVGAVLEKDGAIVAAAHNRTEQAGDPTQHAELLCLQEGVRKLGGRLTGCTLYVTLEPCAMCAGAAVNLNLSRLVFGAPDERAGCCTSVLSLTDGCAGAAVEVLGGIRGAECAALLSDFFRAKRCK